MLKQLELRFPNLVQDDYHFASNWFVYYHVLGFGRISHMTNAVGKSISSATMPQGSGGTGGGFSGGGGGGFGGGGGGYASHNRIEAHRKMRSPPYGGLFYFYPATTGIWNS